MAEQMQPIDLVSKVERTVNAVEYGAAPMEDLENATKDAEELRSNLEQMDVSERAKQTQAIQQKIDQLQIKVNTLQEKREKQEEKEQLSALAQKLDEAERAANPAMPQAPAEQPKQREYEDAVSDVAPTQPEESGWMNSIKTFFKGNAAVGMLIKTWISFQKTLLSIFPPSDAAEKQKQLQNLEQLYGRFFGASDLRNAMNKVLQEKQSKLKILEGTNDGYAYAQLRADYQVHLETLTKGKAPEVQQALITANTFEGYIINQRLPEYLDRTKSEQSQQTTLSAILKKEKPISVVEEKEPSAAA